MYIYIHHLYYWRWGFVPWVRTIPWRRKEQPIPMFLPGKSSMDRGNWWAIVHRITKRQTWLSN